MQDVTYNEFDYLAIGPYCWGRAKTAAEAVRICASNRPFRWADLKKDAKPEIWVWQISDACDEIEVMYDGSFVMRPGEGGSPEACKCRKVLVQPWRENSTFRAVPDYPEPIVE